MITDKKVVTVWSTRNKKWYINKGYVFTNIGDYFEVDINSLSPSSNSKINYKCDYCGKELIKDYRDVILSRKIIEKDACVDCAGEKASEVKQEKKKIFLSDTLFIRDEVHIPTQFGEYVIVDKSDYEKVKGLRFFKHASGIVTHVDGKQIPITRLIAGISPEGSRPNHIDGNKLNNRRENIQFLSNKDRTSGFAPFGKSKYKGVTPHKTRKTYEVRIAVNGEQKRLGNFIDEIAAANAYNYYAKIHYGDCAFHNDVQYMDKEEWTQYLSHVVRSKELSEIKRNKVIEEIPCQHCGVKISLTAKFQRENRCCRPCATMLANEARILKKQEEKRLKALCKKGKIIPKEKQCSKCQEIKSIEEFNCYKGVMESKCKPCQKAYAKNYSAKRYQEKKEEIKQKGLEWRKNNKDKLRASRKLRHNHDRARKKLLIHSLTPTEWRNVLKKYGNKCPLSGSTNLHMEHFIPLAWGHGGTYDGNVYPLDADLNMDKKDTNPFEWAKEAGLDQVKWDKLVKYLAAKNGLTVDMFRDYVYWCEENKRSNAKIKKDGAFSSLQLFMARCYNIIIKQA